MAQSTQDLKDPQKRADLDERARKGETVIPGGTRGTSLEAQEHLAEGRRKGGLSTTDQSGEERAREEGIPLNPLEAKEKQEGRR